MVRSGEKWSALSIQERIKAMNETLDSVEGQQGDHHSTEPQQASDFLSDVSSAVPSTTKRRASVIDMWRKREGSKDFPDATTLSPRRGNSSTTDHLHRDEKKEADEQQPRRMLSQRRGISDASPAPPPLPTRKSISNSGRGFEGNQHKQQQHDDDGADFTIMPASRSDISSSQAPTVDDSDNAAAWEPFGDIGTSTTGASSSDNQLFGATLDTSRDGSIASSSATRRSSVVDMWNQRTSPRSSSSTANRPPPERRKLVPQQQQEQPLMDTTASASDLGMGDSFDMVPMSSTFGSAAASSLHTGFTSTASSTSHLDMPSAAAFETSAPEFSKTFTPSAVRRCSSWGESPVSPKQFPASVFPSGDEVAATSPRSSAPPPRSPSQRSSSQWGGDFVPRPTHSFGAPNSPPLSPRSTASGNTARRWGKPSISDRWPSPQKSSTSSQRWQQQQSAPTVEAEVAAAPEPKVKAPSPSTTFPVVDRWPSPQKTSSQRWQQQQPAPTAETEAAAAPEPTVKESSPSTTFPVVDRWPSPQKKASNDARSLPSVVKRWQKPTTATVTTEDTAPQKRSVVDRWPSPQKKTSSSDARSLPSVVKRWQTPGTSAPGEDTKDPTPEEPVADVAHAKSSEPEEEEEPPNPWKNALKGAKAKWKPKNAETPVAKPQQQEPTVGVSRSLSTANTEDEKTPAVVTNSTDQEEAAFAVDASPVVKPSRGNVANRWLQRSASSSTDPIPSPQKSVQSITPAWNQKREEQEDVVEIASPPSDTKQETGSWSGSKREEENSGTSLDFASASDHSTPREKTMDLSAGALLDGDQSVRCTPSKEEDESAKSPGGTGANASPRTSTTPSQGILRTKSRDSWIKSPASSSDQGTPIRKHASSSFAASPKAVDRETPSAAASSALNESAESQARSSSFSDERASVSSPRDANPSPGKSPSSKSSPSVPHVAPASKSVSSLLKEFGPKTPVGMASQNKGRWLARSSSNTDSQCGSATTEKVGELEHQQQPIIPSPIGPRVSEIVKEHAARTPTGQARNKTLGRWTPNADNASAAQSRGWQSSHANTSPEIVKTTSPEQVAEEDDNEEPKTPSSHRRESVADRFKKRIAASTKDASPHVEPPVATTPQTMEEAREKVDPTESKDDKQAASVENSVKSKQTSARGFSGVAGGVSRGAKEEAPRKSKFPILSFVPPTKTYSARKLPAKKPTSQYIDYEADLRRVQTVTAEAAKQAKVKDTEKPSGQAGFYQQISQPKLTPSAPLNLSRLGTRQAKPTSEGVKPFGFANSTGPRKADASSSSGTRALRSEASGRYRTEPTKQQASTNKPNTPFEIIEAWARKPGLRDNNPDAPSVNKDEVVDEGTEEQHEDPIVDTVEVAVPTVDKAPRHAEIGQKSQTGEEKNRKVFMNLGRRHAAKRVAQATSSASEDTIADKPTFDDGNEDDAPFDEPPSPRSHSSAPSESNARTHPRYRPVSAAIDNASSLYSPPAMIDDNFADDCLDMDTSANSNIVESSTRDTGEANNVDATRRLAAEKIAMRKKLQSHRRRVKRDPDRDINSMPPTQTHLGHPENSDFSPSREPPALRNLSIDNDMAEILQPDSDTPVHVTSPNFVEICDTASSTVSTPSPLASKAEKLLQERRRRSFSSDTLDRMAQVKDPVRSCDVSEPSQGEPEYADHFASIPYTEQNRRVAKEQPTEDTKVVRASLYQSSERFVDPPGDMNPRAPSRLARKLAGSATNSVASDNASRTLSVDTSMSNSPARRRQTKRSDRSVASESKSVNTASNGPWDPSRDIASLMSFDLKKIATAVDEQVNVLRDFVGGPPMKSPTVGVMKSFECGMNNDVEDVAIEVEYIEGSSVDHDDAASDLGVFADPSLEDEPAGLPPKKAPTTPTRQKRRSKSSDMTPGEPSFEKEPRQQGRRGYV